MKMYFRLCLDMAKLILDTDYQVIVITTMPSLLKFSMQETDMPTPDLPPTLLF